MVKPRIALIQVRRQSDPMRVHEEQCVARCIHGQQADFSVHNALEDRVDHHTLREADAFIFGGSGDFSVHDPRSRPWVERLRRLLDALLHSRTPAFGICFGHQLLGLHLDREVQTNAAHAEVGTVSIELTGAGRDDPLLGPLGPTFEAHTGHSDHVEGVPDGVTLLAHNPTLQTQAFKVDGAPFYSVQFHPDLDGAQARHRYLAYQAALHKTVPSEFPDAADIYRLEAVGASRILGQFAKLVADSRL